MTLIEEAKNKAESQGKIVELVRQTQMGDQAAFAQLYDEFVQRIYAFVRIKISGNPEQAEDVVQEVFLKAWKGCKNLELKDLNFSAWLYKVAANTINDYYRKTYREPQITSIDDENAQQIAGDDDPAANAGRGLEKYIVRQTVDQLPPHFKEVIELRFFQDLSVAETARILGRQSITIRVWQHRAVKLLEKIFKQSTNQDAITS